MKRLTSVNVEEDILQHARKYKINLSGFINEEYPRKYMSVEALEEEREAHFRAIRELDERIALFRQRTVALQQLLTVRERRYLATVLSRVRNGFAWSSILRFFNNEFGRSFSLPQFKALVNDYELQSKEREACCFNKELSINNLGGSK